MKHTLILVAFLIFCSAASADQVWELATGISEAGIREVAADLTRPGVIYAASEKRLYRTEDSGNGWEIAFTAKGDTNNINFIAISEQGVFVCTEKGVFRSLDGKSNWKRVFKGIGTEENMALHIAFSEDKRVYLGTGNGLFVSSDNGLSWEKDPGGAGSLSVKWIAFLEKEVFLAAETGVYRKIDSGWRRVFVTETEESEYDSDIVDASEIAIRPVNSIFIKRDEVYLATDNGIFVSKDKGGVWDNLTTEGLLTQKVKRLLYKDNLYAATSKGVFMFSDSDKTWSSLYRGMDADEARAISVDNKDIIWVATNKGLYKEIDSVSIQNAMASGEKLLNNFSHEPTIRDVQEEAIRYAEVHPDKIARWRSAAKQKALLPDLSVGVDRYVTDYWHWDAGQNPDILQKGDDVVSWDVTMTWDLGDFIWSTDQTSIDTRSRLMVQLRDDILDEITRTYFERRRLQLEMYLEPSGDLKQRLENDLRIQELTADLDALTGGYFSKEVRQLD